jgi:hypothetical protein
MQLTHDSTEVLGSVSFELFVEWTSGRACRTRQGFVCVGTAGDAALAGVVLEFGR